MNSGLLNYIQIPEDQCFVPYGMAKDLTAATTVSETKIMHYGGINIQLLEIGRNGHIRFHEPGTPH